MILVENIKDFSLILEIYKLEQLLIIVETEKFKYYWFETLTLKICKQNKKYFFTLKKCKFLSESSNSNHEPICENF